MSCEPDTTKIIPVLDDDNQVQKILSHVHSALQAKGYNPVTQIAGYLLSGDPTYITSHQQARSMICRVERDEILEELVSYYLENR